MPVIRREQSRANAIQPGGVVRPAAQESYAQATAKAADTALQAGYKWSRTLAGMEEDRAVALAERAAISEDENGVPQVDRSAREGMIRSAQKAFDATLDDRFRQRLSVSLQSRLDELAREHRADPEGFRTAATAAVEGMAESVPETFQGFWQDEAARLGAHYGARIGQQRLTEARANAAADFQTMTARSGEIIWRAGLSGDNETVNSRIALLENQGEQLVEQGIIDSWELEQAKDAAHGARGAAMLIREGDEKGWGAADYYGAISLLRNRPDAFAEQFPSAGSRSDAIARLSTHAAEVAQQESMAAKAREAARERAWLEQGMAEDTEDNRMLADEVHGWTFADWSRSGFVNDPATWEKVQRMGFLPASLTGAMRRATRPGTMEPEEREQVFRIWRQLDSGLTPSGLETPELGAKVPEGVTDHFRMVSALMEVNGFSFEEADEQTWAIRQEGFDKERLATAMTETNSFFGADPDWNAEEIDGQIEGWVEDRLTDQLGTQLTEPDVKKAAFGFKRLVQIDGVSPEKAADMVRTSMENSYVETTGMVSMNGLELERSRFAPERAYRVPTDPYGLMGQLEQRFAIGSPLSLLTHSDEEVQELTRPWFDRWAEEKVRAELPDDIAALQSGQRLERGEDYRLVAEPAADPEAPVYRVQVKGPEETWRLLPGVLLDPAGAHQSEIERLRERDGPSFDQRRREQAERFTAELAEIGRNPDSAAARAFESFHASVTGPDAAMDRIDAYEMWDAMGRPGLGGN